MLDFSKVDFNKAISLNPTNSQGEGKAQNPFENCKYELVKLGEIVIVTDYVANGSFASLKQNVQYLNEKDYAILVRLKDYSSGWNGNYIYVNKKAYNFLEKSKLEVGDVVMCNVGSVGICFKVPDLGQPMTLASNSILIKPSTNRLNNNFMFYIFQSTDFQNLIKNITSSLAQPKFNKTEFKNLKIPLPPLEIQKQIVAECEKVEEQYNTVRMSIEKYQELIKAILVKCGIIANTDESIGGGATSRLIASLLDSIQELESKLDFDNNNTLDFKALLASLPTPPPQGWKVEKISQIVEKLSAGGDKPKVFSESKTQECQVPIYANAVEKQGLYGYTDKPTITQNALTISARGTIGYAVARYEPFCPIVRLIVLIPKANKANLKFLEVVINNIEIEQSGVNIPQLTVPQFSNLKIPLPPLEAQEKIIQTIEKLEMRIENFELLMENLESKKAEILTSFLESGI